MNTLTEARRAIWVAAFNRVPVPLTDATVDLILSIRERREWGFGSRPDDNLEHLLLRGYFYATEDAEGGGVTMHKRTPDEMVREGLMSAAEGEMFRAIQE